MYIKKKRQRNGRRRERSYERLAFEAGLDYLLSMIRLPRCTRARYAKNLAERGFDITFQDMRSRPAPKPCIANNTSGEFDAWVRTNIQAKGWDGKRKQGRPLLVKSDLVGHGGRMRRSIEAFTQLCLWAEFLGSSSVHAVYLKTVQGLDIKASVDLNVGDEIAGGVVDAGSHDPTSQTLSSRGQLLGPLSLVNSACRRCANARFTVSKSGVWVVRATKRVKRGASIRVPYAQHVVNGEPLACSCGTPLTGGAVSEDDSESDET